MMAQHSCVVVGQGPSKSTQDQPPFMGRSAKRLCMLMGITMEAFHRVFHPINVHDSWHGKNGKGDAFKAKAGSALSKVLDASMPGGIVLICGLATARAVGIKQPNMLEWMTWEDRQVLVLPHPSGVNRFWNDGTNAERAGAVLRTLWRKIS